MNQHVLNLLPLLTTEYTLNAGETIYKMSIFKIRRLYFLNYQKSDPVFQCIYVPVFQ